MSKKPLDFILRRFRDLEGQRTPYENTWDDITEYVLPHRGGFQKHYAPGQIRTRRLFDTTAVQANEFLASTLHGGLTPSSNRWFALRSKNAELNANEGIKQYLEYVSDRIYDIFNSPSSNFQSQNHELFLDLVAYGTACMYIDDMGGEGIRFKAVHLSELYISEDKSGRIDTVMRKFKFTARQAAQFWGTSKLSADMQKVLGNKPDTKFEILHCVKPNEEYESGSMKASRLPFSSYYIDLKNRHILDQKGYHEMPYLVPRWAKLIGETYGRSPAWSAMPDIKMINVMSKIILVGAEKQIDPPLLMADDGVMMPLQTRPGGVNFGGLDIDGRPRIQPLQTNARLDIGMSILEQREKSIRNAYSIDPLLNSPIKSNVTREEILQRQEEKLRLIGPQIGRIEAEYLNVAIQRVYGLLQRNGQLPELSDEVSDLIESGGLHVEYSSPLSRTQRSQEPLAFQRLMQSYLPLIQAKPELLDIVNAERSFRGDAEILGVPLYKLNSTEEVQAIQQQRAQQQQAMQMAEMLKEGVDTAATAKKAGLFDEGE